MPTVPNFVVVFCDDLGYGDLSCQGSSLVRTPTVDAMARRGMRFTNMYAAVTCTPSRAALLTGCYAPRVNLPAVLRPFDDNGLAAKERTVAEYLRGAGYATACIGKWHLGVRPEHHPLEHGFDRFFGLPYSNDQNPPEPYAPGRPPLYDDREIVEDPVHQPSLTRRYTEQAVSFVRANAHRPFFLYLAHTMPHEPVSSEPAFTGRSAAGPYGDAVEAIDHYLAVLLDELDAQGVRENTCVIFTSDNGPWYQGSAADLAGRKVETYDGGLRVPFVVEWPAVTPAGLRYDEPSCLVDLLPTFLAAAGVEPDPAITLDGRDLGRALSTGTPVQRGDVFYYWTTHCQAVRHGNWKLHVRRLGGPFYTGRQFSPTEELPQLFDLDRDPEESYDLAEHHPDVVAELRQRIAGFDAALKEDHRRRYGGYRERG